MKRINLFLLLLLSTLSFAQSWQSKDVVRIENTESSFHYTFYDSTTLYIQKQNVSYIVSLPNSNYIQVGYLYEGATSKIMSCTYNTLTQPVLSSNSELVDTLNAWLNEPSSGGGSGSQTLSISNDTLSISNGNSVVLPIGASALFPNGLAIIEASRDFQTSDEGKLLILFPNVNLTMPDSIVFEGVFKTIGIMQIDTTSWFEQEFGGTKIKSLTTEDVKHNEIVLCLTSITDDDSASRLLFLSTTIIEEQTALKYLYDKSQTVPTLQQVTDNGNTTSNSIGVRQITSGNESTGGRLTIFNENGNYQSLYQPYALPDDNQLSYLPTTTGTLANSVNGIVASSDGNIDITDEVNTIVGNSRFFISRSASTTDADFNATPGTAYMLLEVADNDKVITLTSPVDGDIYRFNNVTQPTNNWITNVTIFLSDGTTSNVVPASKITIIQYDAASSVFHQISSQ